MPAYALPGTEVGPLRARIFGFGAVALIVLSIVVWHLIPDSRPPDEIRVSLLTHAVGVGVEPGTDVRLDGIRVGSVDSVAVTGPGQQRIGLNLLQSQLFGLTDALTVDYAPGNLFGITALQLNSATGGSLLRDGSTIDVSDRDAGRIRDATLTSLLESTGRLTDQVLTPELGRLLRTIAHDVSAFTPLLQAIGTTARSFTETQQLPTSFLLRQYGSALEGVPALLDGAAELLYSDLTNQQLQTDEDIARFAEMFGKVQDPLLPVATDTLYTAQRHFAEFMPIAGTVLDRVAASVGTPQWSEAELTELLGRLDGSFRDSPDGPILNTQVDLTGTPVLAGPLSELLGKQRGKEGR